MKLTPRPLGLPRSVRCPLRPARPNPLARVWQPCHTRPMKMTMHINEALLAEVMAATGAKSKTAAVNEALRKVATKYRQREGLRKGLGMTAGEIGASYDADLAEKAMIVVAEKPRVRYGSKRSR